jgi:excisionase family DNA binding protein
VAQAAHRLLFGVDGAVVVVPAKHAALLETAVLRDYRKRHRGDNRDLDEVLLAIAWAALHYRNSQAEHGQSQAPTTVTEVACAVTTIQAAERIGCSERTVRRLIHTRRLSARRVGHIWLIDSSDLDRYTNTGPSELEEQTQ